MQEKFAVALSEKEGDDAVREVSLKIKSHLPYPDNYIFIFFTPHYQPLNILKLAKFILSPKLICGVQSPLLIYGKRFIEKGMVACCLNSKDIFMNQFLLKNTITPQNIETHLRRKLREFSGVKEFLFSFLPHQLNIFNYRIGVERVLGKFSKIWGLGFNLRHAVRNYNITNEDVGEGLMMLMGRGIKIGHQVISGFLPLGESFSITKVLPQNSIIVEINNKPAVRLLESFFEEKFNTLIKKRLFTLYPIGIKEDNDYFCPIAIVDCLDDGSFLCSGNVKTAQKAYLLLFDKNNFLSSFKEKISLYLSDKKEGVIFATGSFIRRKILRNTAEEEIEIIHNFLGDKMNLIGIYGDYSLYPSYEATQIYTDPASLSLMVWE